MTTPVLQSLHQLYPGAVIDIVTDRRSGEIFTHCPFRGELIFKNKRKLFKGVPALLMQLYANRYDLIVDLRTDGLSLLLKSKKRMTKKSGKPYGPHAVERHMGVIREIFQDRPIPDTCVWLTDAEHEFARERIRGLPGKRWLSVAPGCHVPVKAWPPSRYAEVCNRLASRFDAVVLLGGTGEQDYTKQMLSLLDLPCLDLVGRTSLLQAAAMIGQTLLYLGNDSGLGHIAGAVSTPTMTLFGIGDPQRYRPWGERSLWLQGEDHDINNITVDNVLEAIESIL